MRVAPDSTLVDATGRTHPDDPADRGAADEATRPAAGPTSTAPLTGRLLGGRYRLHERVGRGATAVVHRSWDALLCRDVAVKVFDRSTPDPAHEHRRLTEMQALAAVDHPGLVKVFDAAIGSPAAPGDAAGPTPTYLVMEYVPGTTLADRLGEGPVPEEQVRRWAVTLARALAEMHAADLVHRDVKPANVLLGASGAVKLGDFGLARPLRDDPRVTPAPDVLGTPAYLSPEQAASEHVGPASDVYSLGLVLLECLTGHREYPGEAISAALARLLRSPAIPADLVEPWPRLLRAMTDRDPDRRPTAAEVATALDAETTLDAFFATPAETPSRWRSVRMLAGSALVAAAAAGLMALGGALFGASPTSPAGVGVSPAAADPVPTSTGLTQPTGTAPASVASATATSSSAPPSTASATTSSAPTSAATPSSTATSAPATSAPAASVAVVPVAASTEASATPDPAPTSSEPPASPTPTPTAAASTPEAAPTAATPPVATPEPDAGAPAGPAGDGPGRGNGNANGAGNGNANGAGNGNGNGAGNGNGPGKPDGTGPGSGNGGRGGPGGPGRG